MQPMQFKLKVPNTKYSFWVMVYDTADQLHQAMIRFAERNGPDGEAQRLRDFAPVGCVTAYWGAQSELGIIRLCRDNMDSDIVLHESIHAAFKVYRREHATKPRFTDRCSEAEERFAYIYGDLAQALNNEIHARKLYSV